MLIAWEVFHATEGSQGVRGAVSTGHKIDEEWPRTSHARYYWKENRSETMQTMVAAAPAAFQYIGRLEMLLLTVKPPRRAFCLVASIRRSTLCWFCDVVERYR